MRRGLRNDLAGFAVLLTLVFSLATIAVEGAEELKPSLPDLPLSNENAKTEGANAGCASVPDVSGIWYGTVSLDSTVLRSILELKQAGGELTGTLTSQGNGGLSKHLLKASFEKEKKCFAGKDSSVAKPTGYGNWAPVPVEEYRIQVRGQGHELSGTCRQEKSKKILALSFRREKPKVDDDSVVPTAEQLNQEFHPGEESISLDAARQYMLELINQERKEGGVAAVSLDKIATMSGQFHTDDSAAKGYNDHYDLEGRSPDWRYSLLGGANMVMENQLGPFCESTWTYKLNPIQRFYKSDLKKVASTFFNELPPNDAHRKNILNQMHNRVGIGLTACIVDRNFDGAYECVCCCQEFVDCYGSFDKLPLSCKPGDVLHVAGKFEPGVELYVVDLRREDLPQPKKIEELRKNFYHGYVEPGNPLDVHSARDASCDGAGGFKLDIRVPHTWTKGLFHVFVWGQDKKGNKIVASHQLVAIGSDKPVLPLEP